MLVALAVTATAQTVSRVEYYWDTDPGRGNGTAITGWSAANQVNVNATISTAGLSAGIHTLGIRSRSNHGVWSAVALHRVVVGQQVSHIEYFYDTDPGFGHGTAYSHTATGGTVVIDNASLSAEGISDGYHRLGIRAKAGGPNGMWSPVYWQNVLVNGAGIAQVEYYWDDANPALGEATQYTGFTPGSNVTISNAQLSTTGLATGMHRLALRARAAGGMWSPTYFHEVFVGLGADYAEYYWDTDPGYGMATPIAFTQDSVAMVDISGIQVPTSDGRHTLCIRSRAGQVWSPTYTKEYCNAPTPMFSLAGSDTVCQNEEIIILDESEGVSAQTLYFWDMQSDGTTDDNTAGDITHTYTQPGTYTLTLGVGNDESCQNTYSHTIVVRSTQSPSIGISSDRNYVCEGTEVRFVATTQRAEEYGKQIAWYRNDELMDGITADTIFLNDLANNDRIRAVVRIDNPCAPADSAVSSTVTMHIYALPEVAIRHRRFIFTDESAFTLASRFGATPTGGTYSIDGATATLFNPSKKEPGMYEISYTYTNNNGCAQTVVDSFELRERVYYTLTATSEDDQRGTVAGSGSYTIGDTATIEATPAFSWAFAHWNDGDTTNPRRMDVMADTSLTAYWTRLCSDTLIVESATACDSYEWRGVVYTASTDTAERQMTSALGCDSTYRLALTILQSVAATETVTACDSYTWHGAEYTSSNNTATYATTAANGCDSTTTLDLTIGYSNTSTEAISACDEYTWHGAIYTASTSTPTYTATNAAGCDSVVTLVLTVNHSNAATETITACDSTTWHGVTYTASTITPTYTTSNAAGCDSVTTLNLTVNYSSAAVETITACNSYVWHGEEYTASTSDAIYMTENEAGCDSTTTLHLTIDQCSTTEIAACDSYTWRGTTYAATGTYIDGTDTLLLTIGLSNTATEAITACDSYTWHGATYTASTDEPTYTTTNAAGCDSTTTLHLMVNHSTAAVETVAACNSYHWHGVDYTASTDVPTFTTLNAVGCDSTTTLHLTVNQCSTTELTVCDSYTWHGTTYTASGTYADGTDTLHLTVNHSTAAVESVTACNSYHWHGVDYTASTTTPTFTTLNAAGCDSTTTLHLTVTPSFTITFDANGGAGDMAPLAVCQGETTELPECTFSRDRYLFMGWALTPTGAVFYTEGQTVAIGNDMALYAVWQLICEDATHAEQASACDALYWHGLALTATGEYGDTIHGAVQGVCDSIYILNLTVNHSEHVTLDTTVADGLVWAGTLLTESGTYTWTGVNASGCDSTVMLNLTVEGGVGIDPAVDPTVSLYPNPTRGKVVLVADGLREVEVYDVNGRRMPVALMGDVVDLSAFAAGLYTLRIHHSQGTSVRRVMKR